MSSDFGSHFYDIELTLTFIGKNWFFPLNVNSAIIYHLLCKQNAYLE